ncbi:MAG: hypothetical protein ACE37H_03900 [Phycisphaeraceae bacterium]
MSRTAIFANAFNEIIQKARKEADSQKSSIEKQLGDARDQLDQAQKRVADLEKQLADIDDELAVGLVAAARDAGIKVDLKRAVAAVNPQSKAADANSDSGKSKPNTAREKAAVMALLQKQHGRWLASTEIKETTGVERPVSVLLKGEKRIESQGKGRGVQYRIAPN